jgi:ABC-type Fe3+-hydroxamate transport system substrate-binding protein
MKQRNQLQLLLTALLAVGLLCSCRSSPVLEEVIYTHAQEAQPDTTQLDPEDDGEEDQRFDNQVEETPDTQRDTQPDQGVSGDQDQVEKSTEVTYSPTKPSDQTATQPGNQKNENGSTTSPSPSTEPSGEETTAGETTPAETGSMPEETAAATRTYKQVVDARGENVSVPEDVGTVTALGAAAQMVEMVGGTGRLIATDQTLQSTALAQAAFSDLSAAASYWSSSAGSISDSDLAALIQAKPDVCFAFSGAATFTDSQVAQLEAAGISYVVLPALSSLDQLKQAVTIVGQVLGGDAETKATSYVAWVDNLISNVSSRTSSTSLVTLYLSAWDSSASYTLSGEYTPSSLSTSGTGLAVAYSPKKTQMVSSCLSAAHITNESTYISGRYKDSAGVYVAPMFHQFNATVSGSLGVYYTSGVPTAYDLFVSHQAADGIYYQLGSSLFPAVIVADSSIVAQIQSNYYWQYHDTNEAGYVEEGGENLYRGIAAPYQIYVNPQGMCSWAEGSVESPLEALWAAYQFTGAYTLEEVKAETSSFYQQFFGITLTADQLTAIFGA